MPPRSDPRPVTIRLDAGGQRALEGVFVAGASGRDSGALIAPPHPLYGGSMDSPVVGEIAWGCRRAGLASLAFNWRGVGASWGEPTGALEAADEDFRAAAEELEESIAGPIVACGYSFGSATAVRVARARRRVAKLVLVAPPPALLTRETLLGFEGPVLGIVGDRDDFAPRVELEALFAELARGRLVVVPGADHFFQVGLREISRSVEEWLGAPESA